MGKKHYIRQRKDWTRSIIYDEVKGGQEGIIYERGKGGQEALFTTE